MSNALAIWLCLAIGAAAFGVSCGVGGGDTSERVATDVNAESTEGDSADRPELATSIGTSRSDGGATQSSDSDEQTPDADMLSIEQWRQEMDEICRTASAVLTRTGPSGTAAVVEGLAARTEGMRSLPRPQGHEENVEELLGVLDEIIASIDQSDNDAAVLAELADPASETGRRLVRLTTDLGIAECGEGDDAASELCGRVSRELVEAVVGRIAEPEVDEQLGARGCSWEGTAGTLAIQTGPISTYSDVLDLVRTEGSPAPGLGDEAYILAGFTSVTGGGTRGVTLWVIEGTDFLAVSTDRDVGEVDLETLRPLADQVISGSTQ